MSESIDFSSKHFIIHSLAEGIFAAIATDGGHAICNSGLVDLGGQLIVFDTCLTPQAASDLRRFATDRYGPTPQLAINSHYHNDHIWGNQVFAADAPIISSDRTRALIATSGMEEFTWYSANSAQQLQSLRDQYQSADDECQRKELLLWMGEYEGVVEALPQLKVCLPNVTFDGRLKIIGAKRSCELINFPNGHSGSDTVLHLPQDGIVFMGDLLFVGCHPYLGDGDPFMLLKALRELSLLDAACYVPGHGQAGTVADVHMLIEYIEECLDTAQTLLKTGKPGDSKIKEIKVPEKYADWQVSKFYPSNINFICQCLSSSITRSG